jgi:hypothetical protein
LQAVATGESKDTAPETPPACKPDDTIRVRPWEIPLPARLTTQEVERHWLALPADAESRKAAQLSYNPSPRPAAVTTVPPLLAALVRPTAALTVTASYDTIPDSSEPPSATVTSR